MFQVGKCILPPVPETTCFVAPPFLSRATYRCFIAARRTGARRRRRRHAEGEAGGGGYAVNVGVTPAPGVTRGVVAAGPGKEAATA
eukprot:gene9237-biopygen2493